MARKIKEVFLWINLVEWVLYFIQFLLEKSLLKFGETEFDRDKYFENYKSNFEFSYLREIYISI